MYYKHVWKFAFTECNIHRSQVIKTAQVVNYYNHTVLVLFFFFQVLSIKNITPCTVSKILYKNNLKK